MNKSNLVPPRFLPKAACPAALAAALALAVPARAFNVTGDAASHRFSNGEKTVLSFTESGSLTVTGSGSVELLVVGGGGGGGVIGQTSDSKTPVAAGGGAGGLVHKETFAVSAGTYAVTVGAGGEIGANGGDSSVFSVTAYGGGYGAKGGVSGSGRSSNGVAWRVRPCVARRVRRTKAHVPHDAQGGA